MTNKRKKQMTSVEVARKGGQATLKKHGKSHFADLARKSWKKRRAAEKATAK